MPAGVPTWTIDKLVNLSLRMGEHSFEIYQLLKEMEWFEHHESQADMKCPACGGYQDQGHENDCRLAAVLKAVEGE